LCGIVGLYQGQRVEKRDWRTDPPPVEAWEEEDFRYNAAFMPHLEEGR